MRCLCVLFLLTFSVVNVTSQTFLRTNARVEGFGGAGVVSEGLAGIYYNQAGMGVLEEVAFFVGHKNHFLIPKLSGQNIGVAVPVSSGVLGVSYAQMGFSLYRKYEAGVAYGVSLGGGLSAGIKANYHGLILGNGYGTKGVFIAEFGVIYSLNEVFTIGFHTFNPNHQRLHQGEFSIDRISSVTSFGISYKASDKVDLYSQVTNDLGVGNRLSAGIEYRIQSSFHIRTGVKTNPGVYTLGFGYSIKKMQLDVVTSYQINLGLSPQVNFSYYFK